MDHSGFMHKHAMSPLLLVGFLAQALNAETILTPWGNLHGIRIQGELVEFEAGLRVVQPDWAGFSAAAKYLQRPSYSRSAHQRFVNSKLTGLAFRQVLTEAAPGEAELTMEVAAEEDLKMAGVFYCLDLPGHEFGRAAVEILDSRPAPVTWPSEAGRDIDDSSPVEGRRIRIAGPHQQLDLTLVRPVEVRVRRDLSNRASALNDPKVEQSFLKPAPGESPDLQVYLKIMEAGAPKGATASMSLTFKATAAPDPRPVRLILDSTKPGRRFDGIGGNFRLQFPKTDPAVISYCLDNLPVRWGRVDLPWAQWDPEEASDALALARMGRIDPRVNDAMEMARTLTRLGMPVIVSVWSVPPWARAVDPPAGLRGTALHPGKSERIVASLANALVFLKERYGVEAALFSLNEPETGVEVRQTSAEHARFVLEMGQRLAERGLSTRMLLGDTAHGTPAALKYVATGLEDATLRGYIGAVAFHTWRGCTESDMRRWNDAARAAALPLLVTESGPDAQLHNYPGVRLEPWFQLQEIDLYVRVCAFAQPVVLMPWQLTSDYSVLSGGGVYAEDGPLQPTQRFWNLKQLGATPARAFALPLSSDRHDVTSAAFGDLAGGKYAIHLVNNGGERRALLSGLPFAIKELRFLLTDYTHGMQERAVIQVESGRTEFTLPPAGFVTLLGNQQ